eukprot:TRINITY_DN5256_c0_g1_i1.p1 TRINITY_DN5256_c0_g1~~TRINITY_DN5256_c0_g1_i1.p1  ORF type:complete len:315 (+),score=46.56 TRINITY_DN5256_c0_g1_i1:143-946(+)
MKWHPDRQRTEELKEVASEKFKEISKAYETLSDDEKRAAYDKGDDDQMWNGGSNFYDVNEFDFFAQMFGEDIFQTHLRMMEVDLWVTLEELLKGTTKTLRLFRGNTDINITVDIQKGYKTGTKITFHDEAVEVTIRQLAHDVFVRRDNDIYVTTSVRYFGREVRIPTVDGGFVDINSSAEAVRLPGYGMPIRLKGKVVGRGSMIITFVEKGFWYFPIPTWLVRSLGCCFASSGVVFLLLLRIAQIHVQQRQSFLRLQNSYSQKYVQV